MCVVHFPFTVEIVCSKTESTASMSIVSNVRLLLQLCYSNEEFHWYFYGKNILHVFYSSTLVQTTTQFVSNTKIHCCIIKLCTNVWQSLHMNPIMNVPSKMYVTFTVKVLTLHELLFTTCGAEV